MNEPRLAFQKLNEKQKADILDWCADLSKQGKKLTAEELYLNFFEERRKKKR